MESLIIRGVGKSLHELQYKFLNVWVWEGERGAYLYCIYKVRMNKDKKMLKVRVVKKRFLGLC